MPKSLPKDYYASVMFPGSKKLSIVSKRLGSKERMFQIAICTNESVADKIVEALNLHQGESVKLEVPSLRLVEEIRATLASERAKSADLQTRLNSKTMDVSRLERELRDATRERDAAQKTARETA